MKKLIFIILLCASCVEMPESHTVSYEVECDHCLATFPDNMFEKSIVVSGRLYYRFENTKLDSVCIKLEKSALVPDMRVKAIIRLNNISLESFEGKISDTGTVIKAGLYETDN